MSKNREEVLFLILYTISKLKKKYITRIQKTLFIFTKEYDENLWVYIPNNFGPNSFELWDDINFLKNNSYVSEKITKAKNEYKLTEKGRELLEDELLNKKYWHKLLILKQVIEYANKWDYKIVDYVYLHYPKYTEKSLIKETIVERMTDEWKRNAEEAYRILKEKIQKSKDN